MQLNGKPIPFNMKIGDAGEAFWVFETDDDVPDELITSPVIEPTTPRQAPVKQQGAFGTTDDSEDDEQLDANLAMQEEIALARVEAARQVNGASGTKEVRSAAVVFVSITHPSLVTTPPSVSTNQTFLISMPCHPTARLALRDPTTSPLTR